MTMEVRVQKKIGNFNLDVAFTAGGVVGLLGPSGSGKTKTLQCIAGIERPDRGRVAVNGRLFFDSGEHVDMKVQDRRVGYLFQHYALFPTMTVEENIACGARGLTGDRRRGCVQAMMRRLRLQGLERLKPGQLSGGQQQRVALARILVGAPEILLLDEPFSALDASLREEVMAELPDLLGDFQKDVVVVTHSYEEAYRLCRTVAVLSEGRVTTIGRTGDVFAQPGTKVAAALTGCRNIVSAVKAGPGKVYIPSWGNIFAVAGGVDDGLCAVGIREYSFQAEKGVNSYAVQEVARTELPFAWQIAFRYAGQRDGTPDVLWRVPKGREIPPVKEAAVRPEDILLLYS